MGISSRARFSAAARGPLVLVLWLGHSSSASRSNPALRAALTYASIGLWKVQVYVSGDLPGCATIGVLRGIKYRSTRRNCTEFFWSHPHAVSLGPRKQGCIIAMTNRPPVFKARAT